MGSNRKRNLGPQDDERDSAGCLDEPAHKWRSLKHTAHATVAAKAMRPLAEAEVVVEEDPSNPGYYSSKFFLKPHYQLEGLTVSLRLVSKLPSGKS